MFGTLFLLALVHLFRDWQAFSSELRHADAQLLLLALASPMLAILLSQSYHTEYYARPYDGVSRLLLAMPILLLLSKVSVTNLTIVQYAFPLGAIGALIAIKLYTVNELQPGFAATSFLNHIHLGDLALMLGILSVLSINWIRKDPYWVIALKMAGLAAGLYVSFKSSARGGWIALPIFMFIWFYFHSNTRPWRKVGIALMAALTLCVVSYFLNQAIRARIDLIYTDLLAFQNGNLDTSIGIRLQLWKAALHMFWENPLFGVGADGFKDAMQGLVASGNITAAAGEFGGAEVHSEMLASMVRFGVFGLISSLLIHVVPFVLFLRLASDGQYRNRCAAIMGMCLVAGFFVFGLTVEIFNLKMTITFFSLTLAVLYAIAANSAEQ